ncbi:MAG: hypothetical protein Q9227_005942 [Pyrenula ochraceoflavens]
MINQGSENGLEEYTSAVPQNGSQRQQPDRLHETDNNADNIETALQIPQPDPCVQPIEPLEAIPLAGADPNSQAAVKTENNDVEKAPGRNIVVDDVPYSSFTLKEKKLIIFGASWGSFLSPLTTNIYYPALKTLSHDLDVSISKINLTITTYMIFQAVVPTFIGAFTDSAGRRPAYMVGFVIYIAANIGLALQSSYGALMALRCLQSAGSSGMVTLATAVITDCITSAERGHYIGYTAVGSVLGPSLSPLLGGVLSQYLGWRSIFWVRFLAIFGSVLFALNLFFFPETCRKLVGDGSLPPPTWNQSISNYLKTRHRSQDLSLSASPPSNIDGRDRRFKLPDLLGSLKVLMDKEQLSLISYYSIAYAVYYAIASTITTQFADIYGLNDLQQGLCFIPISVGSILALVTNGKFDPVDGNYRRHARKLGLPLTRNRRQDLTNFPIERARIEVAMPLLYLFALFTIGYGWLIEKPVNLAGPLVFLAILGPVLANSNSKPQSPLLTPYEQIHNLVNTYPLAVDTKSISLFTQIFTPDATAEYDTLGNFTSATGIGQGVIAALQPVTTQHSFTTQVINFAGDVEAECISYAQANHFGTGPVVGGQLLTFHLRYDDRVRRIGGRWWIVDKKMTTLKTDMKWTWINADLLHDKRVLVDPLIPTVQQSQVLHS